MEDPGPRHTRARTHKHTPCSSAVPGRVERRKRKKTLPSPLISEPGTTMLQLQARGKRSSPQPALMERGSAAHLGWRKTRQETGVSFLQHLYGELCLFAAACSMQVLPGLVLSIFEPALLCLLISPSATTLPRRISLNTSSTPNLRLTGLGPRCSQDSSSPRVSSSVSLVPAVLDLPSLNLPSRHRQR